MARLVRRWDGEGVSRIVFASFGSGLLGAVVGASGVAWLASGTSTPTSAPASPTRTTPSASSGSTVAATPTPADTAELERRLAAVEHTLAAFESRVRAASGHPSPASSTDPASAPHPVDTPVFEAAVMDIVARAEEGRAEERAAAKDEKRRQKSLHWANELTLQLGLSPAQTEALVDIQADLDDALERERARSNGPDAPYVSKEQRRAARHAARESAEGRLRTLLTPPQVAAYEGLDERLKLYREKDAD